ncbi:MAG: hypothetical protein ABJP02_02855 [Parasphingorhabdus sp.]|uniref:hypothetical protein n=1 Tax=Parasphingorhabdus sp. TaxID=2709688 RepID=UPI003299B7A5
MLIFAIVTAIIAVTVAAAHFILGEQAVLKPLFAEPTQGILSAPTMRHLTWAMFQLHSLVWGSLGVAVLLNRLQGGGDLIGYLAILIFAISGIGNFAALRRPHPGGILLLLAAATTAADIWFN